MILGRKTISAVVEHPGTCRISGIFRRNRDTSSWRSRRTNICCRFCSTFGCQPFWISRFVIAILRGQRTRKLLAIFCWNLERWTTINVKATFLSIVLLIYQCDTVSDLILSSHSARFEDMKLVKSYLLFISARCFTNNHLGRSCQYQSVGQNCSEFCFPSNRERISNNGVLRDIEAFYLLKSNHI